MSVLNPQTSQPNSPRGAKRHQFTLLMASLASASGWLVLIWWILGRVLSDRFAWSQWASWTPTELAVAVSGAALAASWALNRFATATPRSTRKWALRVAWAGVVGWLVLVQWRTPALAGRFLLASPAPSLTIFSWNVTDVPGPELHAALPSQPLDLIVITNPVANVDWNLVRQFVDPDSHMRGLGRARVITNNKILNWGSVSLGMNGRVSDTRQEGSLIDPGWASFFELETAEKLGDTIVVWIIDLPSDVAIPRRDMAQTASDAIHAWPGPTMAMIDGTPTVVPLNSPGFPKPDIIMGDFNIPRGSWSLGAITGQLTNAWSDAGLGGGVGPLGSWPRTKPVFHIDQTFIARDLRSCSYKLLDLGLGKHRAQLIGIAKRN